MQFKFWCIRIGFVVLFAILIGNLYILQIEGDTQYAQWAQARQQGTKDAPISRGLIYFTDKHDNPISVVLNKEYPVIFAVPAEIENPSHTAEILSEVVGIEPEDLSFMFSKEGDLYELLVERASSQQEQTIKDLDLDGIYITHQTFRYYPFQDMAAHLLGFIAPSQKDGVVKGRYGAELWFEEMLSSPLPSTPERGESLMLSIDRNIQAEAEKIITNLVDEWDAKGGSILVQNPYTGKILAMASVPSFDPNHYFDFSLTNFLNPVLQEVYEPGSVFKIITMSAGIDSEAITPDTTYYDTGSVTMNGRTIHNWDLKSYGTQTMSNVLERSLNTGAVFAESQTGHKTFTKYVERFGFGERSSIELPGEVKGNINNLYGGRDINYATASFGQGISVTPLQLISAFSAVANGGILIQPSILEEDKPRVVRRVLREETSKQIVNMMVSAVDKNYIAQVPQYRMAGKTGTAYIPDFDNGGYTDNVINTFVGFGPSSNPQFTVLIKLDDPAGSPLAGQTVVPTFKTVAEFLLNYYEVPPDRPQS